MRVRGVYVCMCIVYVILLLIFAVDFRLQTVLKRTGAASAVAAVAVVAIAIAFVNGMVKGKKKIPSHYQEGIRLHYRFLSCSSYIQQTKNS